MLLPSFSCSLLLAVALHKGAHAAVAPDDTKKPIEPCTIASTTGSFYDLRPLSILHLTDGKKAGKNDKIDSWHAKGYDYKSNFTLNICAPVVEDVEDVVGIQNDRWKNVSAFYEFEDKTYSLGQQSANLTLRGRRLVLQYTNGSPCGGKYARSRKRWDEDDDDSSKGSGGLAKSQPQYLFIATKILSQLQRLLHSLALIRTSAPITSKSCQNMHAQQLNLRNKE
ncbi:mannose 6-phosphate receptor [Hyphodiscus hymeniophilus]|uniref:Mannose 6-phosphate receptor n=1 Tax=Hyphodiscus hymeniophilus TaxID=353542 RepID=A0A9P7AUU4_9HELO|nr:mannose 6-phosphate receptor [Hyphodiscus hymeniophilus]